MRINVQGGRRQMTPASLHIINLITSVLHITVSAVIPPRLLRGQQ